MNDSQSISGVRLVISMAIASLVAFGLGFCRECVEKPTEPESIAFTIDCEQELE